MDHKEPILTTRGDKFATWGKFDHPDIVNVVVDGVNLWFFLKIPKFYLFITRAGHKEAWVGGMGIHAIDAFLMPR